MKTSIGITLLSMIICPRCNRDNPRKAVFCNTCGYRIHERQIHDRHTIERDDRYTIERIQMDIKSAHTNWILLLTFGCIGLFAGASGLGTGMAFDSLTMIIPSIIAMVAGTIGLVSFIFYALKERKLDRELREFLSPPQTYYSDFHPGRNTK